MEKPVQILLHRRFLRDIFFFPCFKTVINFDKQFHLDRKLHQIPSKCRTSLTSDICKVRTEKLSELFSQLFHSIIRIRITCLICLTKNVFI